MTKVMPAAAAAARRILTARADPLADLVDVLAPEDQQALARLLSALLDRAYERIGRSHASALIILAASIAITLCQPSSPR